jgi:hypothetical protein
VIIEGVDENGKKISQRLARIEITPFFRTSQEQTPFAKGQAVNKHGVEVDSFELRASGVTGKINRKEQSSKQVEPQIDRQKPKPQSPPEGGGQ